MPKRIITARSYAIVLAGGKSSRMGQDKALLRYEGKTFLEHVIAAVRNLTPDILVVTDRADRYELPDVQTVVDIVPDGGPVTGIVSGLLAAGQGVHFVVPCDMPLASRHVLQLLQNACLPPWDAAIPEIEGELEPLYAVYRNTALPKLQRYLETGRRAARGALAELRVKPVGEATLRQADPHLASFHNLNTPQDMAWFLQAKQPL